MVSAFSTWKRPAKAALLLLLAVGFAEAQAQNGANPAGGGSSGATNSSAARGPEKTPPGQGALEKFQDNLFGRHTVDVSPPGVDDPAAHRRLLVVPPPDERTKERMDAQRNWVFSGINALNSEQTPEDLLGMSELGPDGRAKPRLTAMEKFYNSLDGGPSSLSNQMPDLLTTMWAVKQLSGTNSLSPLIFAFPGGDPALVKSLMMLQEFNHSGGGTAAPGVSAPSPGVNAAAAAAAADREQKRHRDAFQEILGIAPDPPASFSGGNSFTAQSPVAAPTFTPGYSPTTAPLAPSSLSPVTTGFTPAAAGNYHLYDAGFAAPASSPAGGIYANSRASLTQPPKPAAPPLFDPYAANYPKRKF